MKKLKKRVKKQSIRFRQSLFWDVDIKTINLKKHAWYIIERIMDFGTDKEVRWMWNYYPHGLLHDVVKHSRVLHDKTRPLWLLMLQQN